MPVTSVPSRAPSTTTGGGVQPDVIGRDVASNRGPPSASRGRRRASARGGRSTHAPDEDPDSLSASGVVGRLSHETGRARAEQRQLRARARAKRGVGASWWCGEDTLKPACRRERDRERERARQQQAGAHVPQTRRRLIHPVADPVHGHDRGASVQPPELAAQPRNVGVERVVADAAPWASLRGRARAGGPPRPDGREPSEQPELGWRQRDRPLALERACVTGSSRSPADSTATSSPLRRRSAQARATSRRTRTASRGSRRRRRRNRDPVDERVPRGQEQHGRPPRARGAPGRRRARRRPAARCRARADRATPRQPFEQLGAGPDALDREPLLAEPAPTPRAARRRPRRSEPADPAHR